MTKLTIVAASLAALMGCTADTTELLTLSVTETASLRDRGAALPVDANGAETREKFGVIPGALLLSTAPEADVTADLPVDKGKSLVFYCGSAMCSAAPRAAKRALEAGYTDVRVMKDGIKGWVEAGLPVDKPPAT